MEMIQNKDNKKFIKAKQEISKDIILPKEDNNFINNKQSTFIEPIINQNLNNQRFIAILDQKYGLIKKIGEGSTAKVYLAYPLKNSFLEKKLYSVKILKSKNFNQEMFKLEISLLESINSENVLHIYDHGNGNKVKFNGKIKQVNYIIMEFMEHGNLLQYISNISSKPGENIGFGENYSKLIFSQLLDGLESMHNSDVVHRDIKLDNIMIGNNYKLKFVDLGFATKKSNIFLKQYLGTPTYAAPEIHLRQPYLGQFSDIFSLGITLFILVTGSLPFRLPVPNDMLYQFFVRNDYVGFWKQRKIRVSVSFMELFDNLVAFDYTQRPSISEIKKSKWMKDIDYNLLPKLKDELKRREIIINQKFNNIIKNDNYKPNQGLIKIGKVIKDEEIYNCQKFIDNKYNVIKDNQELNNSKKNIMKIEKDEELKKFSSIILTKNIEDSKRNIQNENKGGIIISVESHNLNIIMTEIYIFFKNKGFNDVKKNENELSIFIKDNDLEVILFFQNYKRNLIKINYIKQKGETKEFEKLKRIIRKIKLKKKL